VRVSARCRLQRVVKCLRLPVDASALGARALLHLLDHVPAQALLESGVIDEVRGVMNTVMRTSV
jgi:hypothetical protein